MLGVEDRLRSHQLHGSSDGENCASEAVLKELHLGSFTHPDLISVVRFSDRLQVDVAIQ